VIDRVLELQSQLELLLSLLSIIGGVLVGFYLLGRALPIRLGVPIFGLVWPSSWRLVSSAGGNSNG
jgi:hypothetical protein